MKATCRALAANGRPCREPADAESKLGLCVDHLLEAHDWIAREVGITDVLPWPCLACGSRLGVRYPSGWLCAICEWRMGDIPEAAELDDRVEVVYYLRFGDRIKIGTSGNPRSRLAQLRYEELLAFERGGRATEQKRHLQFGEYRYPGSEWFRSHEALAEHIAGLAAGVEDPWQQYYRWRSERAALRV